jgi:hypothetical protein
MRHALRAFAYCPTRSHEHTGLDHKGEYPGTPDISDDPAVAKDTPLPTILQCQEVMPKGQSEGQWKWQAQVVPCSKWLCFPWFRAMPEESCIGWPD